MLFRGMIRGPHFESHVSKNYFEPCVVKKAECLGVQDSDT